MLFISVIAFSVSLALFAGNDKTVMSEGAKDMPVSSGKDVPMHAGKDMQIKMGPKKLRKIKNHASAIMNDPMASRTIRRHARDIVRLVDSMTE